MTKEYVDKYLKYDAETGLFTRKKDGKAVGWVANRGYTKIRFDGKSYEAHRIAWLLHYGVKPENQIDHINHIRTDNRILNLRDVTQAENHRNMSKAKNNKHGVTGVVWHKRSKRWQAQISVDGKNTYLGSFVSFSDAVNARKNAEILYGFHTNHGKVA